MRGNRLKAGFMSSVETPHASDVITANENQRTSRRELFRFLFQALYKHFRIVEFYLTILNELLCDLFNIIPLCACHDCDVFRMQGHMSLLYSDSRESKESSEVLSQTKTCNNFSKF